MTYSSKCSDYSEIKSCNYHIPKYTNGLVNTQVN